MKIIYYSDFACPYCYIGETRLKKAIAEILSDDDVSINEPVDLEMRSFRLDPEAPSVPEGDTVTMFAKKYRMSPMLAKHQADKISDMGRREGLAFDYGKTRSVNTMDAHRLVKLALTKDHEITSKVIDNLFKAYFGKNLVLTDTDTLIEAGTTAGLSTEEIKKMLASDAYTEDVLKDEENARSKGITGVPYFEIGDRIVSGADSVSRFKEYILAALSVSDISSDKNASSHVCGPEGCSL